MQLATTFWIIAAQFVANIVAQDPGINCAANVTANNVEADMRKHLLCNYDLDYLPLSEIGPVSVKLALFTTSVEFIDKMSMLSYASIIQMIWTDDHLQWSPDDYRQTETITVSSEHIWKPNLALHNNNVRAGESETCPDIACEVRHTGEVLCNFRCELSFSCHGNYRWWPYDQQVCELLFGGWIYRYDEVHFVVKSYSYDQPGGEDTQANGWRIISDRTHTAIGEASANSSTGTATFKQRLELRRHATMTSVLMLTPAAVIAISNLLSLWLAPDCAERLALICLNVFVQLNYLAFISWYLPINGTETPVIVIIFKISMWVTAILEVSTVIARGIGQIRGQPPQWMISCSEKVAGRSYFERRYILKAVFGGDEVVKGDRSSNTAWLAIVRLIDRVLFACISLVYVILLILVLVLIL